MVAKSAGWASVCRYVPRVANLVKQALRRALFWRQAASVKAGLAMREELCRAWQAVEGSEGAIMVAIVPDAVLKLYGDSVLGRYICCEDFERAELQFLGAYLREGDVFLDIGANCGVFTIAGGHRVGASGRVVAFEPGSVPRRRLIENVALNGLKNIIVVGCALSDQSGEGVLSVPAAGMDAYGSLGTPMKTIDATQERVPLRSLAEVVGDMEISERIALAKIDVEGWELRVLRGAEDLLRAGRIGALLIEFADSTAAACGATCGDLFDYITALGLQLGRYQPEENVVLPELRRDTYRYDNLVAALSISEVNARLRRAERTDLVSRSWPRLVS